MTRNSQKKSCLGCPFLTQWKRSSLMKSTNFLNLIGFFFRNRIRRVRHPIRFFCANPLRNRFFCRNIAEIPFWASLSSNIQEITFTAILGRPLSGVLLKPHPLSKTGSRFLGISENRMMRIISGSVFALLIAFCILPLNYILKNISFSFEIMQIGPVVPELVFSYCL